MNYLLFLLTVLMHTLTGTSWPHVASIVIDKPAHTLYGLTAEGDTVAVYDCALGKNLGQKIQEGDCKTPEGHFRIVSVENSVEWVDDASGSNYGPWFMRLGGDTPWHTIGIHGTSLPETVGTRASLGCIRLHNGDLQMLKRMVIPGCDVTILPDTATTPVKLLPNVQKADSVKVVKRPKYRHRHPAYRRRVKYHRRHRRHRR